MPSYTTSPSIDQGAALNFRQTFFELAQQTKSRLAGSEAVLYLPSQGKTNNMVRMGRLELEEVAGRNPNKSYGDYAIDNRQLTKRRFTRTITIDSLYDVNELIADPTSSIMTQLLSAKERVIDRVICSQAIGNVLIGAPDSTPSSVTAANDGVIEVDGTSGFTYDVVQVITQKFINNDLNYDMFRGTRLAISGKENTNLMGEDEFISNDYISGRPVEDGKQSRVGMYAVDLFAGSENGGITVANPVLVEAGSYRYCVALAPQAIALAMEIGDISVERNPLKVNSMDITIDLWINAMRTEGVRVISVKTTI
jgi:hypothetical protein